MNDIFELQEQVAEKVIEGLKLHLSSEERSKLEGKGTENAEAYELVIKASEYFERQTKEGCLLTIELLSEAIELDPSYSFAHLFKATVLGDLYRKYDRDPQILIDAEALAKKALVLAPGQYRAMYPLSQIYLHQGKLKEAEEAAREFIAKDPTNAISHFSLAFFYVNIGQQAKSIPHYEEASRLAPENFSMLINLAAANDAIGNKERAAFWAQKALPFIERHLKLHPNDDHRRVHHAIMLNFSGRVEEAKQEALRFTDFKDGVTIYNAACLLSQLGDYMDALRMVARSIHAGFKVAVDLKSFIADKNMLALQDTPEYQEIIHMLEELEAPQTSND